MRTGNTAELVTLIDQGEIDFALVEGSFDRTAFGSEVFSREPYLAVAAAGERPDSIAELLGKRLVLREPGSGTREILERHLAARELSVSDFAGTIELASIPTIKACVAAGAGVSFLYRVAVEQELADGTLADVTPADFAIEHDFSLIWQRGEPIRRSPSLPPSRMDNMTKGLSLCHVSRRTVKCCGQSPSSPGRSNVPSRSTVQPERPR